MHELVIKAKIVKTEHNKDTHLSTVSICMDGTIYSGYAKCCLEDYDMESNYTGEHIAWLRAMIKGMKAQKRKSLIKEKALLDFYNSLGNKYDTHPMKSKLVDEIERQINTTEAIKSTILDLECEITEYIEGKEKYYNIIREKRKNSL